MKHQPLANAAALLLLAISVGCQSPRTARIQENAALFASLDPGTRKIISDGLFNYGFTPELLYMALGKPNRVSPSETDPGRVQYWVYKNFLWEKEGAVKIGGSTPGAKPGGTVLSSSAPGGPSLQSTKASPSQPTVTDINDAALGTLFIELVDGRVAAARIVH